jgi:hypothetical protein
MEIFGKAIDAGGRRSFGGGDFYARGAGYASATAFPVALENVMHKTLLARYAVYPITWRRFCAVKPASDFRAQNYYRNGLFGALDPLNELGEFQFRGIPDSEKVSLTVATCGNRIALSRKAMVNDDMGAFTDLAARFGDASAYSVEAAVYATLLLNSGLGPTMPYDSTAMFDASHGNITTGAAMSAAAFDLDRVAMGIQTDPSGKRILNLNPSVLVVPKALGGPAAVINRSEYDPDNLVSGSKAVNRPNVAFKLFQDVVDVPYLSGTRRYIFADPQVAPCLGVAFLEGQEAPLMETRLGWEIDGMEWKVRLDYGVGGLDHRGAVTNAGA